MGTDKGIKDDEGKLPYYIVLFEQFPQAIKMVVGRSQQGHEKYEQEEDWENWFRVGEAKGIRSYQNALMRHLAKEGSDSELDHDVATAWNALAILEFKLRKKMYDK